MDYRNWELVGGSSWAVGKFWSSGREDGVRGGGGRRRRPSTELINIILKRRGKEADGNSWLMAKEHFTLACQRKLCHELCAGVNFLIKLLIEK